MKPALDRLRTQARALDPLTVRFTAGEVMAIFEHLAEVEDLAWARLELLREHYGYVRTENGIQVPGQVAPCENPGRYQEDCGHCLRCRSIYSDGALKS